MHLIYRRRKTDANQKDIIKAFEQMGCHVTDLSDVGKGCPDLLVSHQGESWLVEIKNLSGRGNRLTPAQSEFIARTSIPVYPCYCLDDVQAIIKGEKSAFNG